VRKAYERFVWVLQVWSGALAVWMLALVLVGVFYRYVVDQALSWYDEFAGYALVWLTMYGSVAALAKRKHIGFETLVEKLPPRTRQTVEVFGILCVMGFSAVMLVAGWRLMRGMADETAVSIPSIRMAWIYSAMPISGALMLLICAVQIVEAVGGRPGKAPKYVAHVEPPKTTVETE
jgi:TRAP-type C4-dicarboxylate transport system permease small subunit